MSTRKTLLYLQRACLLREKAMRSQQSSFDDSLSNNNFSFLLEAAPDAADDVTQDVNAAADTAEADLDKLEAAIPAGKMPNTRAAITSARAEVGKARLQSGMSLSNLFKMPFGKSVRILMNASKLYSSIGNAFKTLSGALKSFAPILKDDPESRDKTLKELIENPPEGADIPDKSEFDKAIMQNLEPPTGIFGNVGVKLKKAFATGELAGGGGGTRDVGFGLTAGAFVDDVMNLTLNDVDEFLKGGASAIQDAVTPSADDPIQQVTASIEDADIDEEDVEGSMDDSGAGDSSGVSVEDLTSWYGELLSRHPKAPENDEDAKEIGSSLNKLTGKKIFPEGFFYEEDSSMLDESYYRENEELLVRQKLMKMAGVLK